MLMLLVYAYMTLENGKENEFHTGKTICYYQLTFMKNSAGY